jgi:tetratricopeptide (TPR) repeat protein
MTGSTTIRVVLALLMAIVTGGWAPNAWCGSAGQDSAAALDELRSGLGAMEEGEYETALGHYRRALESAGVGEIRFQAHLGMGSAYAATDRLDDAAASYRAALEIKPDHAATLYSLGLVRKDQGRYEEAATLFANAAVRDPQLGVALVKLGIVYEHLGRHEDAVDACSRAADVLEDDEAATLCIAVAFFHMGNYAAATEAFETAIDSNPGNPRAHYGLGLALLLAGDRDGAIVQLGETNQLDPELARDLYDRIFPPG